MSRTSASYLPLIGAIVAALALPATASAAGPADTPPATCTADTQAVKDLQTSVTNLSTALQATPPDPTKLGQAAGDLFTSVLGAQKAKCLPALPASPPVTAPTPPPAPPADAPVATPDPTKCAPATVQLLRGMLDAITATGATPADATGLTKAATDAATAITALNTNSCLPISLPVPTPPSLPAPPAPPVP